MSSLCRGLPQDGWLIMACPISRVWDIVEKARIGMLTTHFNGGLRARPLEARPDRTAGIIWFVTDVRGTKDNEIDAAHEIGLVFIDAGDQVFLSITGRAFIERATGTTKEIWRKSDDNWFAGGLADPNVRVIRIEPTTAELWDGSSSAVVSAYEFGR